MATSNPNAPISVFDPALAFPGVRAARRRRISPQAGRALEILGHAIEYLSDEYVNEGGLFAAHDPRIQAIQLLMARNRDIYFACPELPTLSERLRTFFRPA